MDFEHPNLLALIGERLPSEAVTQGGIADMSWGTPPPAGKWVHLAYTFDGTTTRVYQNGVLSNSEELSPGLINTFGGTKITLAAQIEADGVTLNTSLQGSVVLARVRVHDGVLGRCQVLQNYLTELPEFEPPPEPPLAPTLVSAVAAGKTEVDLAWTAPASGPAPERYGIYRKPGAAGQYQPIAEVPATERSYKDTGLTADTEYCYKVTSRLGTTESPTSNERCARTESEQPKQVFKRGDADGDGAINLTDPIYTLANQFQGGPAPPCMDAADADDQGDYNLTDAIFSLQWQFLAGAEPPKPGPFNCGLDETTDVFADCTYKGCPP